MSTQHEKAQQLKRLHATGSPLVLVNVWDAVSARAVATAPGCRALATASWAVAAAHGVPDGEGIGRDAMLAVVARVAAAVELPVSADLERGYGETTAEVGETIAAALDAGAVGCNLEDGADDGVRPAEEHAGRVAAARAAGDAAGIPLVINARTDVYLAAVGAEGERLGEAVARGRAYLAAGADCVFVPGVADLETLQALVTGIRGPVSVLASAGGPTLAELARVGIARVSYGPGPLGVAMSALHGLAEHLLAGGEPPEELRYRP